MPDLISQLILPRCPHCNVDTPNLDMMANLTTSSVDGLRRRFWKVYSCARCGGLVTASSLDKTGEVIEVFPSTVQVSDLLPERARSYLQQALESRHVPSGAVILAASSVDAMLKEKSYKDGKLKHRIDQAAADHLITADMAKWAHMVRLDANEQRHADEYAPLPNEEDARRSIEFAMALGEFLFVLPAKVKKGLKEFDEQEGKAGEDSSTGPASAQ